MISENQSVANDHNVYFKIGNKRIRLFDLTWVLFLGVLPFDKAALTLYLNSTIGELISLALNAITLVCAFICLVNIQFKSGKKVAQKTIYIFVLLSFQI